MDVATHPRARRAHRGRPGIGALAGAPRDDRLLLKRRAFLLGNLIIIGWIITRDPGRADHPVRPVQQLLGGHLPPSTAHLFGTDRLGRDVLSRVMVGSRDVLIVAPLAALIGVTAGTLLGLIMGYYRGWVDNLISRVIEAFLALPVILVALMTLVVLGSSPARGRLRRRDPVHADRRADRALGRPVRARARLRHRGPAARRDRALHPRARSSPTSSARSSSR